MEWNKSFLNVPIISQISRKISQVSRFPAKSPDSRDKFVFLPKQPLLELSPPVPFGGLLETSCKWIAAAEQFGSWFLHIGFILLEKHPRKCGALGICFFFTFTDYIYSLCIYVVALYVFVILSKTTNWTNPFWGTIRKTKRKTTKAKTRQNVG